MLLLAVKHIEKCLLCIAYVYLIIFVLSIKHFPLFFGFNTKDKSKIYRLSVCLVKICALHSFISNRTYRRYLNRLGYGFRQSRRKGMMSRVDLRKRLKFARKVRRLGLRQNFWTQGISFYLDAVGFVYKTNPADEARAPGAREWRRRNEGLSYGCTAKGRKEGTKQQRFMVAIAYGKGVILSKSYRGRLTGASMSTFVDRYFPATFALSANPRGKRLLQDGCPVLNSKKAGRAIRRAGGTVFRIPARSPDCNPIENLFHCVSRKLKEQARHQQITHESEAEFRRRVKRTLRTYPVQLIDRIIDSMDKRMGLIISSKGQRIRY